MRPQGPIYSRGLSFRRPFTSQQAYAAGITRSALRSGVKSGRWQKMGRGLFLQGGDEPTPLEQALGLVVATGGIASGALAGVLHELDGVALKEPFVTLSLGAISKRGQYCTSELQPTDITEVRAIRCTDGTQTLVDLAAKLSDPRWEQALECALRKKLTTLTLLQNRMAELGNQRIAGVARMRRVLSQRPHEPPTESVLETLMVQLIRTEPLLPAPRRQVEVFNRRGIFEARVDLAWPDDGVFIELDGEHHRNQPRYDASRETAVVACTGWLPARFTWTDVVWNGRHTLRRLLDVRHARLST